MRRQQGNWRRKRAAFAERLSREAAFPSERPLFASEVGFRFVPRLVAHGWSPEAVRRHIRRYRSASRQRIVRLSESQGHRCAYCQRPAWLPGLDPRGRAGDRATIEHVAPLSRGGSESSFNKVMACRDCNTRRETTDAYEFHRIAAELHGPFIPRHLKVHLKRQARLSRPATIERTHGFALWLGYLMCVSQDASEAGTRMLDEIESRSPSEFQRRVARTIADDTRLRHFPSIGAAKRPRTVPKTLGNRS